MAFTQEHPTLPPFKTAAIIVAGGFSIPGAIVVLAAGGNPWLLLTAPIMAILGVLTLALFVYQKPLGDIVITGGQTDSDDSDSLGPVWPLVAGVFGAVGMLFLPGLIAGHMPMHLVFAYLAMIPIGLVAFVPLQLERRRARAKRRRAAAARHRGSAANPKNQNT